MLYKVKHNKCVYIKELGAFKAKIYVSRVIPKPALDMLRTERKIALN